MAFLTMPLSSARDWAKMWSTYALWDPSYQNCESYGFFIDVGNGWSTIVPCLLWNATILGYNDNKWLVVGLVGCAAYWQILYGTLVYFLSFLYNQRYQNRPLLEVLGFVGFANGIWIVFPLVALYACVVMVRDQEMSVLTTKPIS